MFYLLLVEYGTARFTEQGCSSSLVLAEWYRERSPDPGVSLLGSSLGSNTNESGKRRQVFASPNYEVIWRSRVFVIMT
jgi:hypothetical protein